MSEIQAQPATETKEAVTEAPSAQPQPVAQPQPEGFLAKHRVETGSNEWKGGLLDCFNDAPDYLCMSASRSLIILDVMDGY